MQTVFNNREVAHQFANGTEIGRNSGNTFFFEDGVIYSYGKHFPIAKRINDGLFLMTNDSYSNTTAKHIGYVRNAISVMVVRVDNVMADTKKHHRENCKMMEKKIEKLLKKSERARTRKADYLSDAQKVHSQIVFYNNALKLNYKYKPFPLNDEEVRMVIRDAEAKRIAEQKRIAAKQKRDNAKKIKQWLAGESVYLPHISGPALMRVNRSKNVIETSQGASFPIEQAIKAFRAIKLVIAKGKAYKDNGAKALQLGAYNIDSISPTGNVRAGCHIVEFDQIKKCAKELGLI